MRLDTMQLSTSPGGTTVVKIVRRTKMGTEDEDAEDNVERALQDIAARRYDAYAVTYEVSEAR
jgi:hypothetical protein